MTRLRALLVDDEPMALRRLAVALGEIGDVEVVDTTTSARRALELVESLSPDLVFFDISMPGLDGFELVARLPAENRPQIVFVTAHEAHAVRAFGVDALDYLMKPVAPARLAEAVGRARRAVAARKPAGDAAAEGLDSLTDEDSLWAHRHREYVRIPVATILWLEAERDYVRVHAEGGGGLMRATLTALEQRLDPAAFVRLHRSAICRRSAIAGVRRAPTGAVKAVLTSGDEVPVGRSYGPGLRSLLDSLDRLR